MEKRDLFRPEFYASLDLASREARGPIVLSQLDTLALVTAVSALDVDGAVYFVHADARVLRESFRSMLRAGWSRPVLYFHGTAKNFLRDIPTYPALAAVPNGDEALALWQDLPAGATLLSGERLGEEAHWTQAGFLERLGGGEACGAYRTSGRFRAAIAGVPPPIYRRICAEMQAAFFGPLSVFREGSYTPQSRATEPARRWWRDNEPNARNGYGEWPYATAVPSPLPDTLPNGERWPLISVVTPSFNQGKYLEETILSVAGQGYPRIEHIVMDGGSTDETITVLQRYRHLLAAAVSEKDRGQSNAINKGMALATGDILTWLNSDDMLAPGALAAVAMGFHTSSADIVAGIATLRANGATIGHHLTSCEPGPLPLDDLLDLDGGWNAGKFFYQPEVMFSRAIWERAGGMVREDLHYSMDYDLWVRMAEAGGTVHAIGHPVAWFRVHEEQKTNAEAMFKAELRRYVDDFHARTQRPKRASKAYAAPRHGLRIAMLNDHGFEYGAGIAHKRMAEAIALAGHTVTPFALRAEPGHSGEPTDLTAEEVAGAIGAASPDMVVAGNLHSAGPDPWQLGLVAERYPTLAVLHDFWLLTGRCAYPTPCTKYRTGCDASCPTANEYPKLDPDKIAGAWSRKQKLLFGDNQLMLLGNSRWTCEFAREAMAAAGGGRRGRPVEQIRLGFPLEVFRTKDRQTCRAMLGLPADRFIVMLSGDLYDARKNTRLALDALAILRLPNLTIVSLGQKRDGERFVFEDIRRMGQINDPEKMASLYAAADLYVAPSREETFGQVFIESIACGTPVIGVRASGMQEAVVEGLTGLLVEEFSTEALAAAIYEMYRKPEWRRRMGQWGRIYVQNEWSAQASYYQLFRAWRKLGLLERLQVPEKISFAAQAPELPGVRTIHRGEGLTMESASLGPEEGPYPEYSLPRFRWAYGPVSEMRVHSNTSGTHSLVLRYRNLHAGQTMRLALNGAPLGSFALSATGIDKGRLVCVKAQLREGQNALTMEFSRWADAAEEGRPMAAAITEIRFLPDLATA
ncbi:MAG: glycosyltransferase [Bryobacteraceae bacterium]